jgi:hypothetical protein
MTMIRPFDSYDDAARAVKEAGFRFSHDSNQGSGRSFAPTLTYVKGDEVIDVLWNNDRGALRRRAT